MRHRFKTLVLAAFFTTLAVTATAQVSFDIHIGQPPPAPRAYRVPARPGPDYVWVEGYQYPVQGHYAWHDGYWTRPPYQGAYWVEPYHGDGHYYVGHWEGNRGMVAHDHRWDHSQERDENRHHDDDHRR
jgi:hypothetical protein